MARLLLLFPSQAWVDPGRLLLRQAEPSSVSKPPARSHHGGRVFIARAAERAFGPSPAGARRLGLLSAVRRRPLPALCSKEGAFLGEQAQLVGFSYARNDNFFCLELPSPSIFWSLQSSVPFLDVFYSSMKVTHKAVQSSLEMLVSIIQSLT